MLLPDLATAPGLRRDGPWLSLPWILFLVVLFWGLAAGNVFPDGDPYWHVAVGRWIAEHRAVPTTEFFSHSMPGIPWTAHEWGSELVMFAFVQAGGWKAVHVLVALCFAATAAYMLRFLLERMEPIHALVFAALSVAVMYTHYMGRPHVFAWPFTAVWVGTLVIAGERRARPPLWLLSMLLLWTNLHASFTLALGFAGALAADAVLQEDTWTARREVIRRWLPFLIACLLVVLINPRGVGALTHAVSVMRMKKTLEIVSEWRSADFHEFQIFLVWLLGLLAIALRLRLTLSPIRTVFVVGLTYLALKHQRYHALAGLVAPYILARPLGDALRAAAQATTAKQAERLDLLFARLSERARAACVPLTAVASFAIVALLLPTMPSEPNPHASPVKALAAFRASGGSGRVLNAYVMGGYLIYAGVPVFIDGRGDMYGDPSMEETSDAMGLRKPHALETVLQKYQIGWTLLGPNTPAIELLDHLPDWRRVYSDSTAVVHIRRTAISGAAR